MPFPADAFSVTVNCEALEHLPSEQFPAAEGELARVTHGRLVFSVPDVQYYLGVSVIHLPAAPGINPFTARL